MKYFAHLKEMKWLLFFLGAFLGGFALQACSEEEAPLSLKLSTEELIFGPDESSQTIDVTSSAAWEARLATGVNWCTFKDEADGTVSISVQANTTEKKRETKILFTCGSLKKVLLVVQEHKLPVLEVSEKELSFVTAGESKEVQVQSDVEWKAKIEPTDANWVAYTVKEDNPDVLVVTVESNATVRKRQATLSITAGSLTEEVAIVQAPYVSSMQFSRIQPNFDFDLLEDELGNTLPDFSNIGYKGSEIEIPDAPVVIELTAPMQGVDATAMIQNAINEVAKRPVVNNFRGAVLLKKGTYSIFGSLSIQSSGIVLRGEGEGDNGTTLIAAGKKGGETAHHRLIKIAGAGALTPSTPLLYNIKESYVPVGRFWVTVSNPGEFQTGDEVAIYRPATDNWIHDIKMDMIEGDGVKQWKASNYHFAYERIITKIVDDTLCFDNPIMMAMETKYGGGAVYKAQFTGRINHCGIENMQIVSEFDESKKDATLGYFNDEDHSWTAIDMVKTEHSWIRNVTARYFSYGLAELRDNSRYITVKDCKCFDGVAKRTGARLYSFLMDKVASCLVIDCETRYGRHDCITGSKGVGPNAFVRVKIRNSQSDAGPHSGWNIGTLYDNIDSDGYIRVQDRANGGSGHGWAGANQFLWNCKGSRIVVQSPWVSAKNFSIGSKGPKHAGNHAGRPDGVWILKDNDAYPKSLYDEQLRLRMQDGRLYHTGN